LELTRFNRPDQGEIEKEKIMKRVSDIAEFKVINLIQDGSEAKEKALSGLFWEAIMSPKNIIFLQQALLLSLALLL
jgi:hypothetical protein